MKNSYFCNTVFETSNRVERTGSTYGIYSFLEILTPEPNSNSYFAFCKNVFCEDKCNIVLVDQARKSVKETIEKIGVVFVITYSQSLNVLLTGDFCGEVLLLSIPNLEVVKRIRIVEDQNYFSISKGVFYLKDPDFLMCTFSSLGVSKGRFIVCEKYDNPTSDLGFDYDLEHLGTIEEGISATYALPAPNLSYEEEFPYYHDESSQRLIYVFFGGGELERFGGKNYCIHRLVFDTKNRKWGSKIPNKEFGVRNKHKADRSHEKFDTYQFTQVHENRINSFSSISNLYNDNEVHLVSCAADRSVVLWTLDGDALKRLVCEERVQHLSKWGDYFLVSGTVAASEGRSIDGKAGGNLYMFSFTKNSGNFELVLGLSTTTIWFSGFLDGRKELAVCTGGEVNLSVYPVRSRFRYLRWERDARVEEMMRVRYVRDIFEFNSERIRIQTHFESFEVRKLFLHSL